MKPSEWLLAAFVAAIWGLNFSFIKLGVAHLDPLLLAALRFALAAFPLLLWIARPAIAWRWLIAYGLAFGVGTWGGVSWALRAGLAPGLAAWLLQSSAFLTPLLAWLWLGEALSRRQRQGALVAGLGFVLVLRSSAGPGSTALGLALVLLAAASLSLANVIVRRSGARAMLALMVWSSLFAAPALLALVVATQGPAPLQALPAQLLSQPIALLSLAFQVYPSTLFGYWVWNTLIARHGAGTVAPVALLVPVFALAFSALIFGTRPGPGQSLGMALIAVGLVLAATRWRWPGTAGRLAGAPPQP